MRCSLRAVLARVDRLYDVFGALGLRYVLITHHGRLVGMVKKKDLLGRTQQYYEKVASEQKSLHASSKHSVQLRVNSSLKK